MNNKKAKQRDNGEKKIKKKIARDNETWKGVMKERMQEM